MNDSQLLLIDLSGLGHMVWHVSGNEPDPSFVSNTIIARVRSLASAHPHAAICCDSGKSFRADIDPTYKAQRDTENRAPLRHQMDVACETLKRDGFPVWRVPQMEADDLIASAVTQALAIDGATVLIASSDKDLLQLVNDRVTAKSLANGKEFDPAAVVEKFKVHPAQMLDFLCLVGDKSDNIVGARGIGEAHAARLLTEHGTLTAVYAALDNGGKFTDSIRNSLTEFRDRWPLVRSLVALKADVAIPFAEIAAERVAAPMEEEADMEAEHDKFNDVMHAASAPRVPFQQGNDANDAPLPFNDATTGDRPPFKAPEPTKAAPMPDPASVRITPRQTDIAVPQPPAPSAPVDFSQQLEPRTMPEAITLAKHMFESRLFSAYGTPQAVLATVLAGRELGIPAMASLRAFHVIEGKPTMSAGTIQSLVLKSKLAAYFRCTERTAERATFVTKRGDDPEMALTYTIEDGKQAWSKDEAAWKKSGWGRNPADMLVARAASKLARLVYPDVVSGLYAPEEME